MRKKHQVVKFKDIAEKLPELEGKRLEEITKVLGYRNLESCRTNLCKLKQNNRLDFTLEKGVYSKFALLDGTVKEELEDKELSELGRYLKSVDRYKAMLNAFSIAFDSTVKAETRQKAEHDGLKALDRIPDKHYALLYDMMEGER
ncbi:phage protein [Streptococcus pneumoniae]|nr:phage protein [Streptococcus pneumoniae]VJF59010.1 phage protein [Streptococcus pneumoniae]VJM06936.1 phage protein [Streptococcus pneumoniae]VJQ79094.1 phage protein [Streptococcus pneumoniae]VJY25340.1 phage protein [Streptococcus pneumoniae]